MKASDSSKKALGGALVLLGGFEELLDEVLEGNYAALVRRLDDAFNLPHVSK